MSGLVIDANVAVAWFRPVSSRLAEAALDMLCEYGAVVPALWRWEVQDVLRRLEASGELASSAAAAAEELRQLPIAIDDEPSGLFGAELTLARAHGLTVYDAAYLEVAVRRQLPLATIDKKLGAVAKRVAATFHF